MVKVMEMISNCNEYSILDIHLGNCDSNLQNNCKMDQFADFTNTTLAIICGRTFLKTFIFLSRFSKNAIVLKSVQINNCRYNSFMCICNC